jgi:hypothetical protein
MVGSLIVAAAVGTTAAGVAASFALTAAAFAVNFAVSLIVSRVFGQDQQGPQDSGTRQQVPPSSVNAIPIVYGDAYLGGTFVDAVLSTDQKTMYYVVAVSCVSPNGQFTFDSTKFYYGDRLVTFDGTDQTKVVSLTDEAGNVDTKISGNLYINLYVSDAAGNITSPNGAAAPTTVMGGSDIDAALRWVSTGPAPRKMNGLAFAIVKLNYNQDAGTTNLSPITFYAKHYLNSTGAAKPGDVWYDYITNKQYGGAVGWLPDGTFSPNFVNAASATALNAYSDQTITYTPSGGGSATQARYRMNGVLDAGQPVLDNLDKIMTCADSWMAYNAALGQWSIVINKSETAVYAFDDDNIIGEVRVSATDITQSINQVEAKFPDKGARDQPNFVNIATPTGLLYPNEPANKYSVTYDLCNDSVQAQYLANRILEQAREDLIVSFSTTYYGIQVDAGDVVSVTNADYGWNNKLFRVVKVNEASLPDGSLGAKLEMNEYSAAVYDDFDITQYVPVPNSDIPSAIFFSALSTPTVLSSSPSTTPATFVVRTVVPVTGRVTFGTLYYTTSVSPAAYDWKVLQTASTPLGTSATNGANYDFANLQLSAGTYYFTYVVGNELGSSARSPTSTAFNWSPVNSESGNVSALQTQVTLLSIDVADKVSKTTSNILTGTIVPQDLGGIKVGSITWDTSGVVTSGSGIAITENGIVGAKAGVPNFTIDTAGNALFKGDINTAGDAYFAGDNTAGTTIPVGSTSYFVDYSAWADGSTNAASGAYIRSGVLGTSTASLSVVNVGVFGYAPDTGKGYGVIGVGGFGGGYFQSTGPNFSALTAQAFNSTANALYLISGKFQYGIVTIEPPPNNTTSYLRGDGQWVAVSGSGTVTSVSGTGSVSGITLSGTVTSAGNLTLGGSLSLSTGDLTATAPGSSFYLSGGGWSSTSVIPTSFATNSGTASVSSNQISILGSTSTGIAGAYVGSSGSGSTVTLDVRTTSPSDIRLKEEVADSDLGLSFINQLRPVSYKLKADPRHQKGYGFIADEVEDLIGAESSLVYEEPDWKVGDEIGFKTIHYPSYIAVLTKAIQELSAKVDEQQKLIESLQNKG